MECLAALTHAFKGSLRQTGCDLSAVGSGGGGKAARGSLPDLTSRTVRYEGNVLTVTSSVPP